jgi:DNA-binding beta-propeller fold protein YncE
MGKIVAVLIMLGSLLSGATVGQQSAPLKLAHTILLPDVKSGDFDHFAIDLPGHRLFLTAEENKTIEVFDLRTNQRTASVKGVDTPHSMIFLPDANQLAVVDGGDGTLKFFDADKYALQDTVKLELDADSSAYDPAKHLLYIVSGGEEGKMDHILISAVDTTTRKRVADIQVDSVNVEAMVLEKNSPRMFINIRDRSLVGVVDRENKAVLATWPLDGVQGNTPLALDEGNHRLFVVCRKPAKFLVLDSNSGKIVASFPTAPIADDTIFDPASKRIYVAGDGFTVVYSQEGADRYKEIARIPTSFRAKTAILVPELKRFYLAVPRHGQKAAEVRVYDVE